MARPRVVLLHGWTMRGVVFDGLVARLRDVADCEAPDLPGHGAAARLAPTLDAGAALLRDVIARDPRPPVVVGWSMGAAVAWRLIAQGGARGLAGLVTVDMSPRMRPAPDWPHGLKNQTGDSLDAATRRMHTDWTGSARAIAATMFDRNADPRPFGRSEALAQILSEDAGRMRAVWRDLLAADARDTVSRVTCPWLIAHGGRSAVYGEGVAGWLSANAPGAQVARFDGAGHAVHLEAPEAFAQVLTGFLDRL